MSTIFRREVVDGVGVMGIFGVEGLDNRNCWGFCGWATAIFLFRL